MPRSKLFIEVKKEKVSKRKFKRKFQDFGKISKIEVFTFEEKTLAIIIFTEKVKTERIKNYKSKTVDKLFPKCNICQEKTPYPLIINCPKCSSQICGKCGFEIVEKRNSICPSCSKKIKIRSDLNILSNKMIYEKDDLIKRGRNGNPEDLDPKQFKKEVKKMQKRIKELYKSFQKEKLNTNQMILSQINPNQMNPNQFNPNQMNPNQFNPKKMNPNQMNTNQMNPNQMNTNQMNPNQMNTNQSNPNQINPNQFNPNQMNPNQINPNQINPNQINPNQINPNQMNTNQINPNQMNTNQFNPNQMNPNQMNPNQINPNQMNTNQFNTNQFNPNQFNPKKMNQNQMNPNQFNQNQFNPNQMNPNQINPNQMNQNQFNTNQINPNQINPNQMNQNQFNTNQMNTKQMNPNQFNQNQINKKQMKQMNTKQMKQMNKSQFIPKNNIKKKKPEKEKPKQSFWSSWFGTSKKTHCKYFHNDKINWCHKWEHWKARKENPERHPFNECICPRLYSCSNLKCPYNHPNPKRGDIEKVWNNYSGDKQTLEKKKKNSFYRDTRHKKAKQLCENFFAYGFCGDLNCPFEHIHKRK